MAANCHEMKMNEIYVCQACGVELKVVKECADKASNASGGQCSSCAFTCCGQPLQPKM